MKKYLEETFLLNYSNHNIISLVNKNNWNSLSDYEKILNIYNFVRDDILFGYNSQDNIPASKVLEDGYGQCNTKAILFMSLLRSVNIPCRIHGFTIDKKLQKGALKNFYYTLSPKNIIHTWVEVYYNKKWYNLEGFILDVKYIKALQSKFSDSKKSFCGYGVATDNLQNPQIYWNENNTYIQKNGINNDFGVFNNPDDFFSKHKQKLNFIKKYLYKKYIRFLMNNNIKNIRR